MAGSAELGTREGSLGKLWRPPKLDVTVLETTMVVTVQWKRLWRYKAARVATVMILCTTANKNCYTILEIEHGLSTVTTR